MKRLFLYAGIALSVLSCRSQNSSSPKQNAYKLDVTSFETMLEKNNQAILLDVRTPEEYAGGYIRNAVLMNFYDDFNSKTKDLDKSKTYFVYCKAGPRSTSAAATLREQGFKEVYELAGGIMAWENAGKYLTNANTSSSPGMSPEAFKTLINSSAVVLIDFNAKWCAPCKKMSPFLDELSSEYKNRAVVEKIDVDENKELSKSMGIEGLPLLILYKNGQEAWRKNAYADKSELQEILDANL
jgi:thioredoxin 1